MAKSPLHILHLEDDLNDAELVRFTLEAEGIASEITCLQGRDEFVTALEKGDIDLPAALARKVRHLLDEKSPSEPAGPED